MPPAAAAGRRAELRVTGTGPGTLAAATPSAAVVTVTSKLLLSASETARLLDISLRAALLRASDRLVQCDSRTG